MTQTIEPKTRRTTKRKSWWQRQKNKATPFALYEYQAQHILRRARGIAYNKPNQEFMPVRDLVWALDITRLKLARAEGHIAKLKTFVAYMQTAPSRLLVQKLHEDLTLLLQAGVDKVDIGWVLGRVVRAQNQSAAARAEQRHANAKCSCGAHLTKATSAELERWEGLHADCEASYYPTETESCES